jgi:membrane-associated protein
MGTIKHIIEIFLHLDKYLGQIIQTYHQWTYLILFIIIFCETGLVVTPFLPGDSLLFAAGALTATTSLNVGWTFLILSIAAVVGDAVNYSIGYFLGEKLIQRHSRLIKKEHLDETHRFFEKYGKFTIVVARFVPIVRTFAPFVAGLGSMRYVEFAAYNVIGGVLWVGLFLGGGRVFGNIEIVRKNFTLVILAIIVLSIMPIVIKYWRLRRAAAANPVKTDS